MIKGFIHWCEKFLVSPWTSLVVSVLCLLYGVLNLSVCYYTSVFHWPTCCGSICLFSFVILFGDYLISRLKASVPTEEVSGDA